MELRAYINHSGKAVIWDVNDSVMKQLCTQTLAAAQPLVGRLQKKSGHSQPTGDTAFLTVLTFSGNREGQFQLSKLNGSDKEYGSVFSAVTKLMMKLISKSSQSGKGPQ
jgi:hypothetical protein